MRSRSVSSWRSPPPPTPMEMVTPTIITPMITTATRISTRVKPRWRMANDLLVEIPDADVGVGAFAPLALVGTQRPEIIRAVLAGTGVDVVGFPGILAETREVAF